MDDDELLKILFAQITCYGRTDLSQYTRSEHRRWKMDEQTTIIFFTAKEQKNFLCRDCCYVRSPSVERLPIYLNNQFAIVLNRSRNYLEEFWTWFWPHRFSRLIFLLARSERHLLNCCLRMSWILMPVNDPLSWVMRFFEAAVFQTRDHVF